MRISDGSSDVCSSDLQIVVATRDGLPLRIGDVAEVDEGQELRTGAATKDGEEVVLGTVFMLIGENSGAVAQRSADKLVEIDASLPEGVNATAVSDRTDLVGRGLPTVTKTLRRPENARVGDV